MGEVASVLQVENPSAIIRDFKTDQGNPVDIEARYEGQMKIYRQAACKLLSLTEAQVKSQILCVR